MIERVIADPVAFVSRLLAKVSPVTQFVPKHEERCGHASTLKDFEHLWRDLRVRAVIEC
jgi:hypothetical protein